MTDGNSIERLAYALERKKAIRTQIKRNLAMCPYIEGLPDGFVAAATKELNRLEEEIAQEQAAIEARRFRNRQKKLRQERKNR